MLGRCQRFLDARLAFSDGGKALFELVDGLPLKAPDPPVVGIAVGAASLRGVEPTAHPAASHHRLTIAVWANAHNFFFAASQLP